MFECSACTLRAIRAIAGEVLSARHPLILTGQRRRASTAVVSSHGQPYLNAAQLRHITRQESDVVEKQLLKPSEKSQRRALQKEMKWLADPLKFNDHVRYTLRCENPDKALELCRLASPKMNCVVAWNHCIDWHLKKGHYSEGLRLYNEMKKRGQYPDSYTYTILLRGLAPSKDQNVSQDVKDTNAVKAHGIYISMSSPTSKVQPAIIHTNAALKATAQASDLDAFWAIVAQIPEQGPGAADHIAYTTILDCIRYDVLEGVEGHDGYPNRATAQMIAKRVQAADHGRRVWQEVVHKWRAGSIKVDEPLVGAMARLLLASHRMVEWDDVLSLVQQTTQIRRQVAPIGSADRRVEHVPAEVGDAQEAEEAERDPNAPSAKVFDTVKPPKETPRFKGIPFQYAVPGNDILSVIMQTCTRLRIPKAAASYWEILIDEYEVKPDYNNIISYLKLLKHNRASKKAANLIGEDLQNGDTEKRIVFRLALEVCLRDLRNRRVLEHATVVINAMGEMLHPCTDVTTLKHFLNLGRAMRDGSAMHQVVKRLYQSLPALKRQLKFDERPARSGRALSLQKEEEEVQMFLQEYVGAIDTLMAQYSDVLTEEDIKKWKERKNEVTGLIGQGVDKYVAWDAEKASRGTTRRQRMVARPSPTTAKMLKGKTRRSAPDQEMDEQSDDVSSSLAETRNREMQDKAREDFADQFDAINEPVAELRTSSHVRTARTAPRSLRTTTTRKYQRSVAKSQSMPRPPLRKHVAAKQELRKDAE